MAIQWTPDLAVGVEKIDEQHRELFRRFDVLVDACKQRRGKQEVGELLGFLNDYVISHFGEEEGLMVGNNYPDFNAHLAQHKYFMRKLDDLREKLLRDGPSTGVVIMTNQTVLAWLIEHIKHVDTRVGAFLKANGKA